MPTLGPTHGQINVATLIPHGTVDRLIDPQNATTLARSLPHAQVELLPDAGHALFTDQPDRVAQLIIEFLDEVIANSHS